MPLSMSVHVVAVVCMSVSGADSPQVCMSLHPDLKADSASFHAACASMPQGASAASLAESEMSADGPDSHDEGDDDDSEASDGDVAEWDPQPGDAPPLAPGVIKLAEGVLDADVKEVYSRLLADQVTRLQLASCPLVSRKAWLGCKAAMRGSTLEYLIFPRLPMYTRLASTGTAKRWSACKVSLDCHLHLAT